MTANGAKDERLFPEDPLERLAARLTSGRPQDGFDFALGRTTPHPAALFGARLAVEHNVQHATVRSAGVWLTEEREALSQLGEFLGTKAKSALPTSGGAEALLVALFYALDAALPDYRTRGVSGAKPRIYLSQEGHAAVAKAARLLGLGDDAIVRVRLREDGAIDPNDLTDRIGKDLAAGLLPVAIVATVGTTVDGALDDLDRLLAIAASRRLWLHADAAWGGILPFGPDGDAWRARFRRCASVSVDPHKTFHCPLGLGVLYTDRPRGNALRVEAAYVPKEDDPPWAQGIPWSRGAIALPLVALFAALGADGFAAHVGDAFRRADRLRAALRREGVTVADAPLPIVTLAKLGRGGAAALVETLAACKYRTSPVRFASGKLGVRIGLFDHAIPDAALEGLAVAIGAFYRRTT